MATFYVIPPQFECNFPASARVQCLLGFFGLGFFQNQLSLQSDPADQLLTRQPAVLGDTVYRVDNMLFDTQNVSLFI